MSDAFDPARALLRTAVSDGTTPAAVVETGTATHTAWTEAFGRLTAEADAPPATTDTIFDLASLTKVIATVPLVTRAVVAGRMALDDRVARWSPAWQGLDAAGHLVGADVTIRDLLAHCAGLTAYLPFFRDHRGRAEFEAAIDTLPLEYVPRTQSIYSDLGFMLLGFFVSDAWGEGLPAQFRAFARDALGEVELTFLPPAAWRERTAPTEVDPWRGRLLVGEVHDENAYALGGAAGHTGLFGTAAAVGAFARLVLRVVSGSHEGGLWLTPALVQAFVRRRAGIPGSSRALGWDTMLPTSSCGTRLSAAAFGHTGFTGTSLWIDPAAGRYVVLLTNRVHPTRENPGIQRLRPAVHDALARTWAG